MIYRPPLASEPKVVTSGQTLFGLPLLEAVFGIKDPRTTRASNASQWRAFGASRPFTTMPCPKLSLYLYETACLCVFTLYLNAISITTREVLLRGIQLSRCCEVCMIDPLLYLFFIFDHLVNRVPVLLE